MKLEAGKRYKTRDGAIVECVAIWYKERERYQATVIDEYADSRSYTLDGGYLSSRIGHHRDIIAEYKEPKKFEAWVNLDSDGYAYVWVTKEDADKHAHLDRIECRKIEWEVGG